MLYHTDTATKMQSSVAATPRRTVRRSALSRRFGAEGQPHILNTELDHFGWEVQFEVAGVQIVGGDFRALL